MAAGRQRARPPRKSVRSPAASASAEPPRAPQETEAPAALPSRIVVDERATILVARATTAVKVADEALSPLNSFDLGRLATASRARSQAELDQRLVHAGRDLLLSIEELLADRTVWETMNTDVLDERLVGLSGGDLARMEELLSLNVRVVLEALEYQPPPTADEWAQRLKGPLQQLLTEEAVDSAGLTAQAQWELSCFAYRLRRALPPGPEDRQTVSSEARKLLAKILRHADIAVPLAIGVGLSSLTDSLTAGMTTGAAAAIARDKAGAKLVGSYGETATAWMTAKLGRGQEQELAGDVDAYTFLLNECVDLALTSDEESSSEQALFLLRRASSGLLQAVRMPSVTAETRLWKSLAALHDACRRVDETAARAELEAIDDTLRRCVRSSG